MRRILGELPETLDETYERILQKIPKSNRAHTHRLLQCLTIHPLFVEELAEVLAVDFSMAGKIPKLNEDSRWEDKEQVVLSACSSLVAVVAVQGSRVVQFLHFSVKEFLTSGCLASKNDASLYHILPEPVHTIMAQACLDVLNRLDYHVDEERASVPSPLSITLLITSGIMSNSGTCFYAYRTKSTISLTQTNIILPHGSGCVEISVGAS